MFGGCSFMGGCDDNGTKIQTLLYLSAFVEIYSVVLMSALHTGIMSLADSS